MTGPEAEAKDAAQRSGCFDMRLVEIFFAQVRRGGGGFGVMAFKGEGEATEYVDAKLQKWGVISQHKCYLKLIKCGLWWRSWGTKLQFHWGFW